jgi:hypothetical protein
MMRSVAGQSELNDLLTLERPPAKNSIWHNPDVTIRCYDLGINCTTIRNPENGYE